MVCLDSEERLRDIKGLASVLSLTFLRQSLLLLRYYRLTHGAAAVFACFPLLFLYLQVFFEFIDVIVI